jgi:protein-disulfide isomerase
MCVTRDAMTLTADPDTPTLKFAMPDQDTRPYAQLVGRPPFQLTSIDPADWRRGHRDAPLIVLQYGDLHSPACAELEPLLRRVLEDEAESVQLVFRHLPNPIDHPRAVAAALAAELAGANGRFWEMHDLLLDHRAGRSLGTCAEMLGIDPDLLARELTLRTRIDELRADFRRAVADGVDGAPTLFIDRRRHDDGLDLASLSAAVARAVEARHDPA